jgi:hypothetical protein
MGVKLWEGGFQSLHAAELAGAAAGGAATLAVPATHSSAPSHLRGGECTQVI